MNKMGEDSHPAGQTGKQIVSTQSDLLQQYQTSRSFDPVLADEYDEDLLNSASRVMNCLAHLEEKKKEKMFYSESPLSIVPESQVTAPAARGLSIVEHFSYFFANSFYNFEQFIEFH